MNLGGRGCSELRSHHYTPAWITKKKEDGFSLYLDLVQPGGKDRAIIYTIAILALNRKEYLATL